MATHKGDNIDHLLRKYRQGTCTESELRALFHYYNLFSVSQELPELIQEEQDYYEKEIWKNIKSNCQIESKIVHIRRKRIAYSAVAACLMAIISVTLFLYQSEPEENDVVDMVKEEIRPGQEGALLSLGNGVTIPINDSILAMGNTADGDVIVSRDENGMLTYALPDHVGNTNQYDTLTTAKGQSIAIVLSDNTKIWLNAGSRMIFPNRFSKTGNREVQLQGEAYFAVQRDVSRPFIVQAAQNRIEVKGTQFNVHAYLDAKNSTTTVTEGLVQVENQQNQKVLLAKDQQAVTTDQGIRTYHHVDTELFTSWKDGYFTFRGELEDVLRSLENWYNVEIIPQGETSRQKQFYGKISRHKSLNEVIDIISESSGIRFLVKKIK